MYIYRKKNRWKEFKYLCYKIDISDNVLNSQTRKPRKIHERKSYQDCCMLFSFFIKQDEK